MAGFEFRKGLSRGVMEEFSIETGMPIPPKNLGGCGVPRSERRRPWQKLEVGQSFLVPEGDIHAEGTGAALATSRYQRRFIARRVCGGVRIWRIE
jgi:hypothetical protein